MGGSSGSQQQQTSQQTSPWQPTQPLLQSIISQLGGVNTGVTPTQTSALNQLQTNAQGLPNFGGAATNLTGQLLGGLPNLNQNLSGAANASQSALAPYLQSGYLNPQTNPAESQLINTINQDVTNQIGGLFAGAGQSMSPLEAQAMARGLSQGLAGPLFNQYNANVAAQQGAAGQNFNIASGANQGLLGNAGAGLQSAGSIPGLTNMSPLSSLAASNAAYSLPLSQLGGVESMTLPIAGLGGQSQGTSNTQSQYNPSLLSQIGQGAQAFGNIFGGSNPASAGFGKFLGL